MGILTRLEREARSAFGGNVADPPPWLLELFGRGSSTSSGAFVTPDSAMRIAAVYACIRVISETLAMLPFRMFRRLPNGRKEFSPDHPLYGLLHDVANPYQNAMEFREMMTAHVLLRGNAYAQKLMRPSDGVITDLMPLHPDRVELKRLDNGEIRYDYRPQQGQAIRFFPDEIFHFRGLSSDGLKGLSPINLARETIGLAMSAEEYAARFFANDSTPPGVLSHPGSLSEPAQKRIRESWEGLHSGTTNAHKIAVLEEGMKYEKIGVSPRDAQFLESRKYQTADIARIYRVPLHLIGDLDRATNNNIEQQGREFVVYCLLPWATRWEAAIHMQLMSGKMRAGYFAEHNFAELLRGDLLARYQAYAVGRQWGWLSANDVLELENRNPRNDPGGDEYLEPMNMVANGAEGKTPNSQAKPSAPPGSEADPGAKDDQGDAEERLRGISRRALAPIFLDAAERAAKKELEGLRRVVKRAGAPVVDIVQAITQFETEYRSTVERIITPTAVAYAQARGLNGTSGALAGVAAREVAIGFGKSALRRLHGAVVDESSREVVFSTWIEERTRELADAIADEVEKQIIAEDLGHGAN